MATKSSRARLAARLQAEKDDLDGWEVEPTSRPRLPTMSISLRLPPEDIDRLQQRAASTGTTVSTIVRQAIGEYFEGRQLPSLQFAFAGNLRLDSLAPGPFTKAPLYRSQSPEPQIFDAGAA